MKTIIINDHNIQDNEIDYSVTRVKGIVLNAENNIIMEHNNNTFQLPGGHVEEEDLKDALKREILEECGIEHVEVYDPFLEIITYDKNYFGSNKKVINKIYYFTAYTEEEPDFNKTSYDLLELESPFYLYYVNINNIKEFIEKETKRGNLNEGIARELLLAFDAYSFVYDNDEEII